MDYIPVVWSMCFQDGGDPPADSSKPDKSKPRSPCVLRLTGDNGTDQEELVVGTSDCTVCEIIVAEDWVSLWVVDEVDKDDEDEGVSDGF